VDVSFSAGSVAKNRKPTAGGLSSAALALQALMRKEVVTTPVRGIRFALCKKSDAARTSSNSVVSDPDADIESVWVSFLRLLHGPLAGGYDMDLTIRQSLVQSVAVVGSAYGAEREGTMVVGSIMRQPAFLSFPRCAHDRDERPNTGALRTGRSAGTAGGSIVSITPLWATSPWARTKPWATTWFKPSGKRTAGATGYRLCRGRSA
jgi:hypothetical protein